MMENEDKTTFEQLRDGCEGEHDPWEYVFMPIGKAKELVEEIVQLRKDAKRWKKFTG